MSAAARSPVPTGSAIELAAPESSQVGPLARRGAAWSFGLALSRVRDQPADPAVLARLLTPGAYGLIGMVATLTALLEVAGSGGLSFATIQRPTLTRVEVDTLFWTNTSVGALLWLTCLVGGPVLRWFYGAEELPRLAAALGFGFVFSGLALQPSALLQRQMRFRDVFVVEVVGQGCGAILGVVLALKGFSFWALVGQTLAAQAVRCAILFRVSKYRPGRPRLTPETRAILTFSGGLAASGFVIYISRNLDNILVGRFWGATELGFYTRAYFLMTLPSLMGTAILAPVMVSSLSALQHEPDRFGRAYREAVRTISFIGLPLAAGLLVTAPEAVRLVYGPKWLPVVPMLTWLSVAGITQPLYNTSGWLFVARGKVTEMFLLNCFVAVLLSLGFAVGVRWGGTGVAVAYGVLMTGVITLPALYIAHRSAGLPLRPTFNAVAPIFAVTLTMAVGAWAAGALAAHSDLPWRWILTAKIAVGATIYPGARPPRRQTPSVRIDAAARLEAGERPVSDMVKVRPDRHPFFRAAEPRRGVPRLQAGEVSAVHGMEAYVLTVDKNYRFNEDPRSSSRCRRKPRSTPPGISNRR